MKNSKNFYLLSFYLLYMCKMGFEEQNEIIERNYHNSQAKLYFTQRSIEDIRSEFDVE